MSVMCLFPLVRLEKPSISLTSPHAMVIYSPEKISVNQGSTLSITCSTHSKYPGGVFYLKETKTNATQMKAAFGHSIFYLAYFEFSVIDSKQQGDYTCLFSVNVSTLSFNSDPSKSLQVIVISKEGISLCTSVSIVITASFLLL